MGFIIDLIIISVIVGSTTFSILFPDMLFYIKGKTGRGLTKFFYVGLCIIAFPVGWIILLKDLLRNKGSSNRSVSFGQVLYFFVLPFLSIVVAISVWQLIMLYVLNYDVSWRSNLYYETFMYISWKNVYLIYVGYYTLVNCFKFYQVYRKKQLENFNLYIANSESTIGFIKDFDNNIQDVFKIYDKFHDFIKDPVNVYNYFIFPILFILSMFLMKFPSTVSLSYSFMVLLVTISLAIQPLLYKYSKQLGNYMIILNIQKIIGFGSIYLFLKYVFVTCYNTVESFTPAIHTFQSGLSKVEDSAQIKYLNNMNLEHYFSFLGKYIIVFIYPIIIFVLFYVVSITFSEVKIYKSFKKFMNGEELTTLKYSKRKYIYFCIIFFIIYFIGVYFITYPGVVKYIAIKNGTYY